MSDQQQTESTPDKSGETSGAVQRPREKRRGIYLLPNLLTTGAMFGGFYAILAGMDGKFEAAAIAIFIAMIFDGLDGRVARMTDTSTDFGVEYDSLSDMVSFGIAPAVVCFSWILNEVGRIGWAAAFIYASCAALRLARFNTQIDTVSKRYFIGLSSPTAAAVVAAMVWAGYDADASQSMALLAALVTAVAGLLMVSNFRYYSFKEVDLKSKVPFVVIFAVAMVLVVVTINPPKVLLAMAAVYALSAPAISLWKKMRRKPSAS
ncbi:MAG: CDP-diacylglycerol--serine O-phosphatidyltransferase [Pseudomonadales bacterium]|nr:CDP-diacylglycerol--serine O-phosphatidyltransferase [Pseudomonadales bacterium]MCP5172490.1 CDP-diacylglycerol--serine O-phosphatidyltransferase [Pseudomonadales bacterium]